MRRFLTILLLLAACWACVGQKEDPEEIDPQSGVEPGGATEGDRFFHRVLAFDFTATWCQYCPNMTEALMTAKQQRPGRIVDIAVHYSDEMSAMEAEAIVQRFKVSAFPTALLDLDPATKFTRQEAGRFTDYVDKTVPLPACGVALASSYKEGVLGLSVSVRAVADGSYAVAAALVEDGIVAAQTGAGSQYVNNAVLRGFLGDGGMDGKSIGSLKAGETGTLVFSAAVSGQSDNLRVIVYILQDGTVINADSCSLNETSDYEYEPYA